MLDKGEKFTAGEVAAVLGINKVSVTLRAKKLGLDTARDGYVYEEIKRIAGFETEMRARRERVLGELRKQLVTDGFAIAKSPRDD